MFVSTSTYVVTRRVAVRSRPHPPFIVRPVACAPTTASSVIHRGSESKCDEEAASEDVFDSPPITRRVHSALPVRPSTRRAGALYYALAASLVTLLCLHAQDHGRRHSGSTWSSKDSHGAVHAIAPAPKKETFQGGGGASIYLCSLMVRTSCSYIFSGCEF